MGERKWAWFGLKRRSYGPFVAAFTCNSFGKPLRMSEFDLVTVSFSSSNRPDSRDAARGSDRCLKCVISGRETCRAFRYIPFITWAAASREKIWEAIGLAKKKKMLKLEIWQLYHTLFLVVCLFMFVHIVSWCNARYISLVEQYD